MTKTAVLKFLFKLQSTRTVRYNNDETTTGTRYFEY